MRKPKLLFLLIFSFMFLLAGIGRLSLSRWTPGLGLSGLDAPGLALFISIDGSLGDDQYFRSPVTVSLSATGADFEVARTEYRLNGRDWIQADHLAITSDGAHGLEGRAIDFAGNVTYRAVAIWIDTIPPQAVFRLPEPNSITPAWDRITLAGQAFDTGSGVSGVEISVDGGKTWQMLPLVNEIWRYEWDTTSLSEGAYQAIVRARDRAGNVQSPGMYATILVAKPASLAGRQAFQDGRKPGSFPIIPKRAYNKTLKGAIP